MAPKRKSSNRLVPYDPDLLENWTLTRLKDVCKERGLTFPSNARRFALIRLIKGNSTEDNGVSRRAPQRNSARTDDDSVSRPTPQPHGARSHDPVDSDVSQDGRAHDNNNVLGMLATLTHSVSMLTSKISQIERHINVPSVSNTSAERSDSVVISPDSRSVFSPDSDVTIGNVPSFDLHTAYRSFYAGSSLPSAAAGSASQLSVTEPQLVPTATRTNFGYAAHSLPMVETISPTLQQQIIAGKDVNLAALLIPFFRGSGDNNSLDSKPDFRLHRSLNLGEFIQAFSTYKQVMCRTFPHRRVELDLYERDVIEMASRFPGQGFYEYHCEFSKLAAAQLRFNNRCVDWSVRDTVLFNNIFTNRPANSCSFCGSSLHLSGFCPSSVQQQSQKQPPTKSSAKGPQSSVDTHGRPRIFHGSREICNNFNGERGCSVSTCSKAHICLSCKSNHSSTKCPLGKLMTHINHK